MAYRIEQIHWNMMPEGATHFTLETSSKFFSWYKVKDDVVYGWAYATDEWDIGEGERLSGTALSVMDHHPDWVAKRKEQQAREASCKTVQAFVEHILNKHKLMLSAHSGEARRAAEDYCRLITEGKA